MNPIEFSVVGGPTGDPCVWWRGKQSPVGCLFDFGSVAQLPPRDLIRATFAFVTHAHMDHFHGFDHWLRAHVPHRKKLFVAGPRDISFHVQSKLRGYLWNLIEPDQLDFTVKEIHRDGVWKIFRIRNSTGFGLEEVESGSFGDTVVDVVEVEKKIRVSATVLDHKTEVLAYAVDFGPQHKLDTEKVTSPGPWIKEIKETDPRFSEIFKTYYHRALVYVTDIGFTDENAARVAKLGEGVLDFICETNYRASEEKDALQKMHLTTEQAAKLARSCSAQRLHTFHISNIYKSEVEEVLQEAQDFFSR